MHSPPIRKYPQTYDYGFFGDDPLSPTFLYCVDKNGKTISNYVDPATASTLIQSKLGSGKRYYFGPTAISLDPYQSVNIGAGITTVVALNYTGLSNVDIECHPKSVLSLKDGEYSGGVSGYVFANYMSNCSYIHFHNVSFDGRSAHITGADNSGFIFNDNFSGAGHIVDRCTIHDSIYATYGDPNEYKSGTLSPDTEWAVQYTNNHVYNCTYGLCLHNGPGGALFDGNFLNNIVGSAIWVDSCNEIIIQNNMIRLAHNPIYIMDGVWYCNIGNNDIGQQPSLAAAIQIVKGGEAKPECAYVNIHDNIIHGFRYGINNECSVGIIARNNIFIQGAATDLQAFYGTGRIDGGGNVGGGSILRGEIRAYGGTIATLTENAFNSINNPFGQNVALLSLDIYVATGATATSPNIDCGIGASATTDYVTLFDDLPGETIGLYNSKIATPGTQTQPILWQTGAGNRYLNMSIKDAAATGMVATYVATVMGL